MHNAQVNQRGRSTQYVRAYVRRNKTDATDATTLLEAARASDIRPVRVKSVEQQALQGLQARAHLLRHAAPTMRALAKLLPG